MKKIFVLIIILIILLPISVYSQSTKINIAVLKFTNNSGLEDYDYISPTVQKSIYESLSSISGKDISVISYNFTNIVAEKYDININNIDQMAKILKFCLETKANLIILGEYDVIKDKNEIKLTIQIYSPAKKSVIAKSIYKGSISANMFEFIDNIALSANNLVVSKKEEIKISLEELYKEANPPKYIIEPTISEVNIEYIKVNWYTNKETIAVLYLLKSKEYKEENIVKEYEDENTDALRHSVTIPMSDIIDNVSFYIMSKDIDFTNQTSTSNIVEMFDKIKSQVEKLFEKDLASRYELVDKYAEEHNYDKALIELDKIFTSLIPKYSFFLEINEEEIKSIVLTKIEVLFKKEIEWAYYNANEFVKQNKFKETNEELEKILTVIIPKYEGLIKIDKEKIKEEIKKWNNRVVKEQISSLYEEKLEYYPWYLRVELARGGIDTFRLVNNPIGSLPVNVFFGLEAGVKLFKIGLYPYLSVKIPFYTSAISGSLVYEAQLSNFGAVAFDLGVKYFTKPARITFDFSAALEMKILSRLTELHQTEDLVTIGILLDAGFIVNIPIGFYYNFFVDFTFAPFVDVVIGLEAGLNFFLGAETPYATAEFVTTLYPIRVGFTLSGLWGNITALSLIYESKIHQQGVQLQVDVAFLLVKNLYLGVVVGLPIYMNTSFPNETSSTTIHRIGLGGSFGLTTEVGVEWLINPSNTMVSLMLNTRASMFFTNPFRFTLAIIPTCIIQFLFPFGAYFKLAFPINVVPYADFGLEIGFGVRWYI